MGHITGVGGAFVFSNDAARLAEWYADAFGLRFEGSAEFGAFYQVFFGLDPDEPTRKLDTTLSIMQAKVDVGRPAPATEPASMYGDQPFMLNLRVRDLDALVDSLKANGVPILKREDHDYGRFAWIRDLDGHRVELYQPVTT